MIDINSHFLPGLDDGAKTIEDAVAMIEMAAADGTTHLVATPHCNDRYQFSLERNRALLAELRARAGDRIQLSSGCDFHLSFENLERVAAEKSAYTLNQGSYLLTEFASYGIAPQVLNVFHRMRLYDIVPVITHPERNPLLQESGLKLLRRLVEMGCPMQITAGGAPRALSSPPPPPPPPPPRRCPRRRDRSSKKSTALKWRRRFLSTTPAPRSSRAPCR